MKEINWLFSKDKANRSEKSAGFLDAPTRLCRGSLSGTALPINGIYTFPTRLRREL